MVKASKWLSLLLVLALAFGVVGLVGCTSEDEGEDEETTEEETTEEESEEMMFTTVEEGVLTVGSDTAYPPFEFIENDEVMGFDVDLVAALAEEMGYDYEFLTYNFDALIVGLQSGSEFDMIASAMTITDERKEEVDFSDPYIDSGQSLAVREDSEYATLADLTGQKIGVQSGTTGEAYTNDNLPEGATVVPYENILQAFAALQAGDVEGVVNDFPVSANIVTDETRGLKLVEEIDTGEQYGFAVSKDNPELTAALNDALQAIKDDGTYDEIFAEWFGEAP
jgi:polar amino acid transport system substrate-binding protein